jgi:hypothetical protein
VYTSSVFHKTQRSGNVQWNQSPAVCFSAAAPPLTRRRYWSIFAPALINSVAVPFHRDGRNRQITAATGESSSKAACADF